MNWDLTSYFPEFQGSEYKEFKENLSDGIKSLDEKASASEPLCRENSRILEGCFSGNGEACKWIFPYTFLRGMPLSASDSNREDYLREEAAISLLGSDLEKLEVQLQRALRDADEDLLSEFVSFPDITLASYYVRRVWQRLQVYNVRSEGNSGFRTGS